MERIATSPLTELRLHDVARNREMEHGHSYDANFPVIANNTYYINSIACANKTYLPGIIMREKRQLMNNTCCSYNEKCRDYKELIYKKKLQPRAKEARTHFVLCNQQVVKREKILFVVSLFILLCIYIIFKTLCRDI